MSKLFERLEKLKQFGQKQAEFKARVAGLNAEMQAADREFSEFMEKDLGVSGQLHISEVLKATLESTYEPTAESKLIL